MQILKKNSIFAAEKVSNVFADIMHKLQQQINIRNRRAFFDYEILDRYISGIQLYGTEIKAIRDGHASLVDTYCMFYGQELWVKNMNISEYKFGTYNNHIPRRDRKLLLQKKELQKLLRQTKESGKTIVPLRLFINDRGLAKLEIALCQGKHDYDKRQTLKEKEDKRMLERLMKK